MEHQELLEDTWHDVLCKALRGQQLDISLLAEQSKWEESLIQSLVEEKTLNEETLATIASLLSINYRALLAMARNPYQHKTSELPPHFKRFITSYHGMKVNSYFFWSKENKKGVAFDTGADLTPILKHLDKNRLNLDTIFLTHGHGDHVCQLQELIERTGASAWIDQRDAITGAQSFPVNYLYQLDTTTTIEARPTPGHSPGGTTFVIRQSSSNIAIVGDALFASSIGGMEPAFYHEGLKAIQEKILLLPEETIIAPGHGPLTTVGYEKRNNPFFA